jgi:hypothetical protein
MSSTLGPLRPKWVRRVELVKDLSFLPVPERRSSVQVRVRPERVVSGWSRGMVSGTRAGVMRGVVVWPRARAKS